MSVISLEMDVDPSVCLAGREFAGMLLQRQIHLPLTIESVDGTITPGLVSEWSQRSPEVWTLRIEPSKWPDGDKIRADDVARRLVFLVGKPQFAWLAHIISGIDVRAFDSLDLRTRFVVGQLDAVLTNPLLSPRRDPCESTGSFSLTLDESTLSLTSRMPGRPSIRLRHTRSRHEGKRLFTAGDIDVAWGIGVPSSFWGASDSGPFATPRVLDMFAVLTVDKDLPCEVADNILRHASLAAKPDLGLVPASSRFQPLETSIQETHAPAFSGEKCVPLYFSDFEPNGEIASFLAGILPVKVLPTPIRYGQLLNGHAGPPGVTLSIQSTVFASPLGLTTESLVTSRGCSEAEDLFRCVWASEGFSGADKAFRRLEAHTDKALRRVVLGRIRTRFRSSTDFPMPPSGLFDAATLNPI